jgi:hypothetical protein
MIMFKTWFDNSSNALNKNPNSLGHGWLSF